MGGNQYRFNLDRTISANLLAHFGVGFCRFHNPDSSPHRVLNYDVQANLGLVGSATGVGFPAISGLTYNNEGGIAHTTGLRSQHGRSPDHRYRVDHRKSGPGFTANIPSRPASKSSRTSTATKTIREPQGVYAFSGAQTAIPFLGTTTVGSGSASGSIGSGYASFLLGAVNSTTVNPPKATQLRRITEGLYFQDNFKVTSKLTLEMGVRWDRVPLGT